MFPCRYGRRNFMNPPGWLWVGWLLCGVLPHMSLAPGCVGVGGVVWLWTRVLWLDGYVCLGTRYTPMVSTTNSVVGVGVWWVASLRPISTGRLGIAAVHLRPINPLVWWGP